MASGDSNDQPTRFQYLVQRLQDHNFVPEEDETDKVLQPSQANSHDEDNVEEPMETDDLSNLWEEVRTIHYLKTIQQSIRVTQTLNQIQLILMTTIQKLLMMTTKMLQHQGNQMWKPYHTSGCRKSP